MMHFVDGSYALSVKAAGKNKQLFSDFEDFIRYCQVEVSKK